VLQAVNVDFTGNSLLRARDRECGMMVIHMNRLLRRVAKDLRYRPLAGLLSRKVHLDTFDSAVESVSSWLEQQVPYRLAFSGPESKYIGFALLKYGILDLTFKLEQFEWRDEDVRGLPLLQEFGFIVPTDVVVPPVEKEDDPTCLTELTEDLDKNQAVLRLFLEKRPGNFGDPEYLKRMVLSGGAGKMLRALNSEGEEFKRAVDGCFPTDFSVSDACISNAAFVWFHKHFYL
jgi:hypothetical protein